MEGLLIRTCIETCGLLNDQSTERCRTGEGNERKRIHAAVGVCLVNDGASESNYKNYFKAHK